MPSFLVVDLASGSGNYSFTGVFTFHSSDTSGKYCGEIDTQNAIIYYEAFRYAIRYINSLRVAPYTIGYRAVDTCDSSWNLKRVIKALCSGQYDHKIVAVVGPSLSNEALEMSHVFNVWRIPTLSYGANSAVFDDRNKHEMILRTVPSDSYQVEALLDIIRHFNWSYFSAVSSCNEQDALTLFQKVVERDKRCFARKSTLPCTRSAATYEKVIKGFLTDKKVRAIVLFAKKDDIIGLLTAAKRLNVAPGRFVWVASTSWGNLALKNYGLEEVATGALSLIYASYEPMTDFKRHFLSLNPTNNNYTFFVEYWEALFNCSTALIANSKNRPPCNGTEKLTEGKGWYPYTNVEPVIDATLAAFRGFYREVPYCFFPPKLCILHGIGQSRYLSINFQKSPTFSSIPSNRSVTFDPRGGVIGRYDILNYGKKQNSFVYNRVGTWRAFNNVTTTGRLEMFDTTIYWGNQSEKRVPRSVCSEPCQKVKGEIKDERVLDQHCCWKCIKCAANDKIVNNTCITCMSKETSNRARDSCVALRGNTIQYTSAIGSVILTVSVLGFIGTSVVVVLFLKFYSSPIVKASGRESSFFMITGIYLSFIAPVIFLSKPAVVVCGIQRFIAGLSFSVIYAPLFLKTNRIFRIFQSAKMTTARPSLISPLSQVLVSLGIIFIQLLLGIVWVIGDSPRVKYVYPKTRDNYQEFCFNDPYTMVLNLVICLLMMLACTWYAFRTRHFPKNYNETKSIMFTLYFSCFAWGVFLPTYLKSSDIDSFFRTYTIAMFCDIIGFISLIGFFMPKIRLLVGKAPVNDSPVILSQLGQPMSKVDDVRHIIVEEHSETGQRTVIDNISNNSSSHVQSHTSSGDLPLDGANKRLQKTEM